MTIKLDLSYDRIGRCPTCTNNLPLHSDNSYCQRCNEGWDGFIDVSVASEAAIRSELRLALQALDSSETRDTVDGERGNSARTVQFAKLVQKLSKKLSEFHR